MGVCSLDYDKIPFCVPAHLRASLGPSASPLAGAARAALLADVARKVGNGCAAMPTLTSELLDRVVEHIFLVSFGNPHCVIILRDEKLSGVEEEARSLQLLHDDRWITCIGQAIEHEISWFPQRTNVEFVLPLSPHSNNNNKVEQETRETETGRGGHRVRVRVWERGEGLTLACGSGACAAAVAAHLHFGWRLVETLLDGGSLVLRVGEGPGGAGPPAVVMSGEAALSCTGFIMI